MTKEKLHTCKICGQEKTLEEMAQQSGRKTGHRGYCKSCRNKQRKENGEVLQARAYNYMLRAKVDYMGVSGDDLAKIAETHKECAYCGSRKKLTFDHIYNLRKGKYNRNIPANITVCCDDCNNHKKMKSLIEFYDQSEEFTEERLYAVIKDFFGRLVHREISDEAIPAIIAGMRAEVEEEKAGVASK